MKRFLTVLPVFFLGTGLAVNCFAARWWDADLTKENPKIKKAVDDALGTETTTGYWDSKAIIPLIKDANIKYSRSGADPAALAKLVALVYKVRNTPGIDQEPIYASAKKNIDFQLSTWTKKVDSLSFAKICTLYVYKHGYEGLWPPILYIKSLGAYLKDDIYYQEALVEFMTFRLKDFSKSEVILAARSLASAKSAIYTHAKVSGFALNNLAILHKDKSVMEESIKLLKKYHEGMRTADRNERTRLEIWIGKCRTLMTDWK